jgi:DNA-binding PadR family transcriptional regulator
MATSDTTRMLVLGVTQIFEPANGYQLRRELLSWNVQEWANVNPGSIYSMLTTLTKLGLVDRTDIASTGGAHPVAVYRTTPAGNAELVRLVRDGITSVHEFERTEFYAAASLMVTLLRRDEVIPLLETRIENLRLANLELDGAVKQIKADAGAPPHVSRLIDYSATLNAAEAAWLGGFIEDVRAGQLTFLGEPAMQDWKPADNDPAWRMVDEREQYLKVLNQD